MLNVPILALAVKFSLFEVTTPLPVPESGTLSKSQASLAVTSQEHPFAEFTLTDHSPSVREEQARRRERHRINH